MLCLHARARSWPPCVSVCTPKPHKAHRLLSLSLCRCDKVYQLFREQRSNQHFGMRNMPEPARLDAGSHRNQRELLNEACCTQGTSACQCLRSWECPTVSGMNLSTRWTRLCARTSQRYRCIRNSRRIRVHGTLPPSFGRSPEAKTWRLARACCC